MNIKIKILSLLLVITFGIKLKAQETSPCQVGIYLVQIDKDYSGNFNSVKTGNILYLENTFDFNCEKNGWGSLQVPYSNKLDMQIQFFEFLQKTNPELLNPFKGMGFSNYSILALNPNDDFKEMVYNETGADSPKFNYTINKVSGFVYNKNKYAPFNTEAWKNAYAEYKEYFKMQ